MESKRVSYSDQIADEIIEWMCNGGSLRRYTKQANKPNASTIHRWVTEDKNGFASKYARAMETRADVLADEMQEIADDVDNDALAIAKAKLQIDTRRWYAEKVKPKVYGNKLEFNDVSKAKTLVMIVTDKDIDDPPDDPPDE
jgi:hypothetical protein